MKIRTTERDHPFTQALFSKLKLFTLQGLTINSCHEFTAAIEAIQYEEGEPVQLECVFPFLEVKAKYYLAKSLQVPFYYVVYQSNSFSVFQIEADEAFKADKKFSFNEGQFIKWWACLKGLNQPKPLMEAAERVKDSIFDNTLMKYNLAWGGNIDGYMFKNKTFACIIENIYTQRNPLESPKGEPSWYFHKRGPNYNTWYPTVKLAMQLKVPLFLFTIEGNSQKERIGFTVIDSLSSKGIHYYKNIKPNENIIYGINEIEKKVLECLNYPAPRIYH